MQATLEASQIASPASRDPILSWWLFVAGLVASLLVGLLLPHDQLAGAARQTLSSTQLAPNDDAISEDLLAAMLSRGVLAEVAASPTAHGAIWAALARYQGIAVDPDAEVELRHCIAPHALAQLVTARRYDLAARFVCHNLRLHPALARLDSGIALLEPCLAAHCRAAEAADVTLLSVTDCQVPHIAERLFKSVPSACQGALAVLRAAQPVPLTRRTSSSMRPASPSSSAG